MWKRMPQYARLPGFFVVLLATMLSSSCAYFGRSPVTIHNESNSPLVRMSLKMAGEQIWVGDLPQGKIQEVASRPSTDGTIGVTFEAGGKLYAQEFGYVTPGIRQHH